MSETVKTYTGEDHDAGYQAARNSRSEARVKIAYMALTARRWILA